MHPAGLVRKTSQRPVKPNLTRIAATCGLVVGGVLVLAAGGRAQAPDPTTAAVERAGRYVETYEKDFSGLVCEELQTQKLIRSDGKTRSQRILKSDFALVKAGTSWMQMAFRDVIEVDGKPVKNRPDRLRKLFIDAPKTALAQAQAIAQESQRYNIGMPRTGNSPLLPIMVLHPKLAPGFRFNLSGESLAFDEFKSPSFLSYRDRNVRGDLMSHGSFVLDVASGRLLSAELTAAAPGSRVTVGMAVAYHEDPLLKMLVPTSLQERYWQPTQPKEDRLEVNSTYSNFRRFQVTTEERIKRP